jgi:fatty acyl-ACP thioesterase A
VGKATSQWIAFNLKTRRMGRIPSQVVEDFQLQQWCDEPIMGTGYEVEKLPDARDIGAIEGSQCSVPVVHYTRRSDLDMNGHVNNCIYTEWLLESVPQSYRDEYELKELIIEFKAECNFGDVIEAVCCEDTASKVGGSVFLAHTLTKKSDEKQTEVVRARTIWAKR